VVLKMCEHIASRVPVDLCILVSLGIVDFDIAGVVQDCEQFEIGVMPFHLAFFCFRKYTHGGSIFSYIAVYVWIFPIMYL